MRIKISIISIYLIIVSIISIPFISYKYLFLLDFVSNANYHILDLVYGKDIPEYGGFLPIVIALALVPTEILQETLIFIILFFSAYSMHKLNDKIILSREAQFYASFFYMINPYTYIRIVTGQLFLLISYAILPFLLKIFINLLERKEKKEMIKFIVLLSIIAFNIHILIIALIMLSIIFLFWFNKYRDIRILKFAVISAILFILLNSYWVMSVLTAKNTVIDNIGEIDFEVFAPKGELFDMAAMYGFWIEVYKYTKDFLPGWQILYLIILSLTVIGFIYYYKDEKIGIYVRAFAVIGIVGFILASGVNGPFGEIVRWLFDNTILKGFRDSHKFVAMMVLAYSVLGGLGLNKIKSVYDNKYN